MLQLLDAINAQVSVLQIEPLLFDGEEEFWTPLAVKHIVVFVFYVDDAETILLYSLRKGLDLTDCNRPSASVIHEINHILISNH